MLGTRAILLDRGHRRVGIDVAGTGAISQLARGVLPVGVFGLLVWSGLIVACVATRAIRLKGRELPVNNLRIRLMAFGTLEIAAVILRLVGQANMTIVGWRPRIRLVTHAAVLPGIEMTRVLAGGLRAVVAGRAGPEHLVVVYSDYGLPYGRAMAVFANIGCLYVQRPLAGGLCAVVTRKAVIDDVDMVEIRR